MPTLTAMAQRLKAVLEAGQFPVTASSRCAVALATLGRRAGGLHARRSGAGAVHRAVRGADRPLAATATGVVESTAQALASVGAAATMAQAVDSGRASAGQGLARAAGLLGAAGLAAASGAVYATGGPRALSGGTAVAVVLVSLVAWMLLRGSRTSPHAQIKRVATATEAKP